MRLDVILDSASRPQASWGPPGGSGFQILVWMLCGLSSRRHFSFWSPTLPEHRCPSLPTLLCSLSLPAVQPLHPAATQIPAGDLSKPVQGKLVYGIFKMCLVEKVVLHSSRLGKARCSKALYVQMCFLLTNGGWNMQLLPSQSYQRILRQEGPFSAKLTTGSLICSVWLLPSFSQKRQRFSSGPPPPPVALPTWTLHESVPLWSGSTLSICPEAVTLSLCPPELFRTGLCLKDKSPHPALWPVGTGPYSATHVLKGTWL